MTLIIDLLSFKCIKGTYFDWFFYFYIPSILLLLIQATKHLIVLLKKLYNRNF